MPAVINTNVLSLNAQRNLETSQSQLATALQRLSSGLRINSARDDAAGLAISERFTTQIRGLNQATRNANDGISLAQTAESALAELTSNLQRIRELGVQSANATNSPADRAALDAEVQQRIAEIDRIARQTSFNGQRVLDGSFGSAQFQVGANVGETITVNFATGVRATQIGQIATQTGTQTDNNALTAGGLSIAIGQGTATTVGASVDGADLTRGQASDSAYAKVEAINAAGISGLTALADNSKDLAFADVDGAADYDLSINGVAIYTDYDATSDPTLTGAAVADKINQEADRTGVRASFNAGVLTLSSAEGGNITVVQDKDVAGDGITETALLDNAGAAATFDTTGAAQTSVFGGEVTLSSSDIIDFAGSNAGDLTALGFDAVAQIAVDAETISGVSVTSVANAELAIQRVDAALTTVSALRSDFGAVQNRFESTIANLQAVTENLSASRSRIQDTDFAAETAALTKAQILQQAGIAILAQANAAPQSVLGLLQ